MKPPPGAGMSNYDIRAEGWKALTEHLGVAGAMRFLMEYDPGRGDYTRERQALLADVTLDSVLHAIGRPPRAKRKPRRR